MTNDTEEFGPTKAGNKYPIVRDPNYSRIVADAFLIYPLKGAIEVAVLVASPEINGQDFIDEDGTGNQMSSKLIVPVPTYFEVSRLRIDNQSFPNLVRSVVDAAISNDLMSRAQIQSILDEDDDDDSADLEKADG
jgi:hypothetical protein